MATIPLPLIGRSVSSVVSTPQISDSVGLLSNAAMGAQTVTAIVYNMQFSSRKTTRNISALTSRRKNAVPIERDDTVTFTEIMRGGAGSVVATAIWTASDLPDWALFQTTRGGTPYAFYGLLAHYEENVGKDISLARLTLRYVDTDATLNPAYG